MNRLMNIDALSGLAILPRDSVPLILTSPPYDHIHEERYGVRWSSRVWRPVIAELYRVTVEGGVVLWMVRDGYRNGGQTGTSERQVIHFMRHGFMKYAIIYVSVHTARKNRRHH